jgi:8-amino-7-oxononanoate synthase
MQYIMESEAGTKAIINKTLVDYFSGCGYFGFQSHPDVVQEACNAVMRYGISSATTPAFYGNNPVLIDIYEKAVQFFGTEDAMFYVSGCFGNPILLEGLKAEYDVLFIDEESHYSARVATSLANKPAHSFKHLDAGHLKEKIKTHLEPGQRPMIVCDGVFPISGALSPLPDYLDVLNNIEGASICVDDAHATGVLGNNGYGTIEHFGLKPERLYFSGTLSKALGGHGGIIAGSSILMESLRQNSSLAKACSSVPIPAAAATAKALDILYHNPQLRTQLWANVAQAKDGLRALGFNINNTPVPIICLDMPNGMDAHSLQQELFKKDIAVTYVPEDAYTSVPKGGALRISIFSNHTTEQIKHLIREIGSII